MTDAEKKALLQRGIDAGNFPKLLYKYRTIDQAEKILDNFSLWFSTPDKFNDPFDCGLSEKKSPSIEDARKHLTRLGQNSAVIESAIQLFKREPGNLAELVAQVKNASINRKGILSLSEKYDDILMWSHYSNNHKGVVIGLEMEADLGFFITPVKMDYRDKYDELNYLADPDKSILDTIKIKSSQWEYEREIRIYKNQPGLHKINKQAIKHVYFGINSSKEDIERIRKKCVEQGLTNISFLKGKKAHGLFKVEFDRI